VFNEKEEVEFQKMKMNINNSKSGINSKLNQECQIGFDHEISLD
jgi:hypothetical protein